MSRRTIYQGRVVDFGLEEARMPDGRTITLEIVRHPGAAAVLPLHEDGTVTLIHQHRHAAGGLIYEVPAGVLEKDETPEGCAARELAEEVQLRAERLQHLTTIHTTPGFTNERIHLFLATGLQEADGQADDDEYLRAVRLPLSEAIGMIEAGRITDAKTVCALLLAARARGG